MFHHLLCELVGTCLGGCFAVDADDGLGVALAEVHPTVGEVDFDAVDGGDFLNTLHAVVEFGDFCQEGVDVHVGCEVLAVFGDDVFGVGAAEFAGFHAALGEEGEEERHADERVAAVVQFGVDDTAVAFAADDGMGLAHEGGDVDLAHGGGVVLAAAVALGDVAQGA